MTFVATEPIILILSAARKVRRCRIWGLARDRAPRLPPTKLHPLIASF